MSEALELIHDPGIGPENYSLTALEINRRIANFMRSHPPRTNDRVYCYELDESEIEDVARTVERIVFEKRLGETAESMARIYGPYESASTFFLSVDQRTGMPVGTLRVTDDSDGSGLMTLNETPKEVTGLSPEDVMKFHHIETLDDCLDVGTVALMEGYVGKDHAVQLYRAMYLKALQMKKNHLLSIIDVKPYAKMKQYLGIPFTPLAGSKPFEFEGSPKSIAVHGYIPDFYDEMSKHRRSLRGRLLARTSLDQLVHGSNDGSILLQE